MAANPQTNTNNDTNPQANTNSQTNTNPEDQTNVHGDIVKTKLSDPIGSVTDPPDHTHNPK